MSSIIRIALVIAAAVVAIFIAMLVLKIVFALALFAAVAFGGVFVYHFGRALYRRVTTPAGPPVMLR